LTALQLTPLCNLFSSTLSGCVQGSGGGMKNFLPADRARTAPPSGGGGTNIQTTNYTIQTIDCGKTVALGTGSTGYLTVTLPAAAGFSEGCTVNIKNGDTYPGGRAKALSGFPADFAWPTVLWPTQAGAVQIINGGWATLRVPVRWSPSTQVFFNIDPVNGNDANDGLATGAGNALQHVAQCFALNSTVLNPFIQGANCKLVNGTYSENATCFNSNGTSVAVTGDAGTPTNVNWTGTLAARDGCIMSVTGLSFSSSGGPDLECTQSSTIDVGNVAFAGGSVGFQADAGCVMNINGTVTLNGNILYPFTAYDTGFLKVVGATITIPSAISVNIFVYLRGGRALFNATTIGGSGAGSVTGAPWNVSGCGSLQRGGLTIPGSGTGTPAVGAALTSSNCAFVQ
jgi:hypothetical protein